MPKRHSTDLFDIPAEDLTATALCAQRVARAALSVLGADGVNLLNCSGVAAWRTVFHVHMHVIPRCRNSSSRMTLPYQSGRPADAEAIAERARLFAAHRRFSVWMYRQWWMWLACSAALCVAWLSGNEPSGDALVLTPVIALTSAVGLVLRARRRNARQVPLLEARRCDGRRSLRRVLD